MDEKPIEELRTEFYDLMRRFRRERYMPAEILCDLTYAEMEIVRLVHIAAIDGKVVRPSDIARFLRVTPSAVSQSVKKLETQGYIERVRSEHDSRVVVLALTEQGEAVAAQARAGQAQMLDELIEFIGPAETQQMLASLARIFDFFEQSPVMKRCEEGDDVLCV